MEERQPPLSAFQSEFLLIEESCIQTEKSPMTPTPSLYRGPKTSQARQWEGGIRTICGKSPGMLDNVVWVMAYHRQYRAPP